MQTTESMLITIKEKLHSAGYKLTPQREATIKILLEKETEHMSAEEIYLAVKKKKFRYWLSYGVSYIRNFI